MDMKKKLEETYIPDKTGRKEKVLVGISGPDSLVTAYLLKIQKYDLVAVTIIPQWDEFGGDAGKSFSCHHSLAEIEGLRDFCHKLSIPFHAIKLTSEFRDRVIEPWVSDKLVGKKPWPCWSCHELRLKALFDKMNELGATQLATGHFAKLFRNEGHGTVYVHSSNDEDFDQSALLSRLPHNILAALILPLSDLTKKEVAKLAENFGIGGRSGTVEIHHCLHSTPELGELIAKISPTRFKKGGSITSLDGSDSYGDHEGVFRYEFGDPFTGRETPNKKPLLIGPYAYLEKRISLVDEEYFMKDKVLVVKAKISEEVSVLEPFTGFAKFLGNRWVECYVMPKTLDAFSLELGERVMVIPGEIVSVYRRKGKNSKLFFSGEGQYVPDPPTSLEGESRVPKTDFAIDY